MYFPYYRFTGIPMANDTLAATYVNHVLRQLRRIVRWRTVSLGICLTLAAFVGLPYTTAGELAASTDADTGIITIREGDRVLLQYQSTPAPYKVYVKQWSTPGGLQVLRDSPHDHVHHHALMYAIGADGVDFWGENPNAKPGRQVPRGDATVNSSQSDDQRQADIRQTIDWIDAGDNRVLAEERALVLREGAVAGASRLEWKSRFTPAAGREKSELWGRHYFGLGMRFVESMDRVGTFVNAAGETGENVRGTEQVVIADWCAYTAPVDGKPVTVAMFGHPDGTRHPPAWFTMTSGFAYISATLNLSKEPLAITSDEPLDLFYAVVIWDGKVERDRIQAAYDGWIKREQ
jgi:hypothetical protein